MFVECKAWSTASVRILNDPTHVCMPLSLDPLSISEIVLGVPI